MPSTASSSRLGGTRWVLHSNALTERGDSVDLMEIAGALRMLGVDEIAVCYLGAHPWNSPGRIAEMAAQGLELVPYATSQHEAAIMGQRPSHFLAFGSGALRGNAYSERYPHRYRFGDYVHILHAAFRQYEPHGDLYAYVSDWLLDWSVAHRAAMGPLERAALRLRRPSVDLTTPVVAIPHGVSTSEGDRDAFRSALGIPDDAAVLGRIGGRDQFTDREARRAVVRLLDEEPDTWFVAVNTARFHTHPRLVHVPFLRRDEVGDFYSGIDVLLNGRRMGESFGLNIVEALQHDRAVIAPAPCRNPEMDLNHTLLLRDRPEWLYCSTERIVATFRGLRDRGFPPGARGLVGDRFTRRALAARLDEVVPS